MRQPVILLGAGRSGTKFLRAVLSSSREVVSIPYDVGYIWRYGNEGVEHDQLGVGMLNERTKRYVRKTLPALVANNLESSVKFMVEKSVPNTLRPEYVFNIFPEAKFIHLMRDGRAVTESAMRMWRDPPDKSYLLKKLRYFPWSNYRYAWWYIFNIMKGRLTGSRGQHSWGPRYIGMDSDAATLPLTTVCARQWRSCIEVCSRELRSIPSSQVIEVRYEDILNNTGQLEKICDFIGIRDSKEVLSYFNTHVIKNSNDSWKKRLSDEELKQVLDEIGDLLLKLGYEKA